MKTKREILFADSGQRWQQSDVYATQPTLEALALAEQDTQHLPVVSGERWQQDDAYATQPGITLVLHAVEDTQPFRRERSESTKKPRWWAALKKLFRQTGSGGHSPGHPSHADRPQGTACRVRL